MKCEFCSLSEQDKKYQLYKNDNWTAYLADNQNYIGRCIVVCNHHVESISDLSDKQWNALKQMLNILESAVKHSFGADLFNWACLMNNAYKSESPSPHIHFHMIPRYKNPVVINGKEYKDKEFSHHYDNKKKSQLNTKDKSYVRNRLVYQIYSGGEAMRELWDVLDKNRNLTGETVLRAEFPKNADDYHLAVHIWIKNKNNEWLISKRTPNKTEPLKWEHTGGSVLAGENSLQGALREVKEELGIDLDKEKGKLYKSFRRDVYQDFCDVWIFEHDCDIKDIVLQEGETCDAMWASNETIKDMIAKGVFVRLDNMKYVYDIISDDFDFRQ